ncbi:transglycosylase SLT domain-containing protein [Nocardia otitidiscaviarum]|uniref:transglycosylase SLT domain-containing protein n=1 Tax=Nocardia otitidiscaviarum TaxID=1823 RepID=UPI0004A6C97B|nr:transglycosylase SLT domain-containing protein [Nocardia otitidiscaviarum]MBF6131660.1 transglycosylase SLT domain-containing protein [Nocardia otitidiscaviarum]MBF6482792.1 transglycosylase SLT domain-containing protein [Nocardia otitidiscaviarum]
MPTNTLTALRCPHKRSKVVAAARTASAAVLAVGVFGAIAIAGGNASSSEIQKVSLAETLAATAEPAAPAEKAAEAPAPAPMPAPELPAPAPEPAPAPAPVYENNLDGWIREALDIMRAHGIPGSYEGIYRNIIRESSGNPQAINLYDSNAAMGIPSKGLLQVIDPTFAAYHVPGTPYDVWDPVANIVAACNYAAARYGSMDNVFGAY